jgi:acyl transferase domain-containing protein
MNVNSACSSGLVAVAQAVRALQAGDCDMAVAGAASLSFPNLGYMYVNLHSLFPPETRSS